MSRISNMKKISSALAGALLLAAGVAHAQGDIGAYAQDAGKSVTHDNYGECVHTGYWTKADAIVGCDGATAPAPAPIAAPVQAPAAAPAPAATAPAAAPAPTVMKRAPKIEKVSLSADALFAFNKANLKKGAAEQLDQLVEKLNGETNVGKVTVTGYTDSIGSKAYNLKLSAKRAATVKAYLVKKHLNAEKIVARGLGKSHPVASNKTAAGRAKNRRVEVTVEASRTVE